LLPAALLLAACNSPIGTRTPQGHESNALPAGQPKVMPTADDPYFVASGDTVSLRGPRSIVRNMLQDQHGNFWFASWEGIVRYDGTSFTNLTNREGLRRFHVFSVLEDRRGNLWFGTIGGGVYRYDGKFFTNFTELQGLVNDRVDCMVEDRDGNIWFGTDGGVSRFDGIAFYNFTANEGLSHNSVHGLAVDRAGKLWVGTHGGVSIYDGKSFTPFTKPSGTPFWNVRSILEDRAGNLWIGGADGLWRYDGRALTEHSTNFTGYLLEDRHGNLWISAGEPNTPNMSLYRYDGTSFTEVVRKDGPRDHQVFGIFEDRAGVIWFGTMQGACRYDGREVNCFGG
jgi:ligand-binding sensor domain-containing protein